jgi:hypothetical protein
MDELNTDMWMDAGRGSGCTTSDLTNRSLQIDRFPLDEPEDLTHAYTIVVAPQHTVGADVHPVNHTITRLLPDTVAPWRGNVIVFRHGKTASKVMINLEERDTVAVQMILTTWVLPFVSLKHTYASAAPSALSGHA